MADKPLHPDTLAIHGGFEADPQTGSTTTPIHQASAFAYETAEDLENVFAGRDAGYIYTRINNPTVTAFERRITALEGGIAALGCASGMAAINAMIMTICESGDEIVSGASIFGGTFYLFERTLKPFGVNAKFVPSTDLNAYRAAITDRTRMIFVEALGNPKLDTPRIASIAEIAKEYGIPLVVDSTAVTPALFQAGAHGANIVIHSTSKYLNGHGNAIGGAVVDCGTFDWAGPRTPRLHEPAKKFRHFAFSAQLRSQVHRDLGGCLAPMNAFLVGIGMDSLGVRMERHCSNALALARAFDADPRVAGVRYPGLTADPSHAVAKEQFGERYGGLLCIHLGDRERCYTFMNALERAQILANLGDAKTLVVHPASTICRDADAAQREAMGVTDDLVRIAVGIEHFDDILDDMNAALDTLA